MLKPFTLEFQPLLEEVLKWEKEVKECGDMAIMQTILGLYSHVRVGDIRRNTYALI